MQMHNIGILLLVRPQAISIKKIQWQDRKSITNLLCPVGFMLEAHLSESYPIIFRGSSTTSTSSLTSTTSSTTLYELVVVPDALNGTLGGQIVSNSLQVVAQSKWSLAAFWHVCSYIFVTFGWFLIFEGHPIWNAHFTGIIPVNFVLFEKIGAWEIHIYFSVHLVSFSSFILSIVVWLHFTWLYIRAKCFTCLQVIESLGTTGEVRASTSTGEVTVLKLQPNTTDAVGAYQNLQVGGWDWENVGENLWNIQCVCFLLVCSRLFVL